MEGRVSPRGGRAPIRGGGGAFGGDGGGARARRQAPGGGEGVAAGAGCGQAWGIVGSGEGPGLGFEVESGWDGTVRAMTSEAGFPGRAGAVWLAALGVAAGMAGGWSSPGWCGELRAGAARVDVSPEKLPVIVNGGFLANRSDTVRDRLYARAVVLDDGSTRIAIVVVDSCMLPRELIDRAKAEAAEASGVEPDRALICATHTHSAPAAMSCLGTPVDAEYAAGLPSRIASAIVEASRRLEPAEAGWGFADDYERVHCRRWIYQPDKMIEDPFGNRSARANMHPGHLNPNTVGPSGPSDPALTVLSVRARGGSGSGSEPGSGSGRTIALLANYSMHYFGAAPVSADYFGLFAGELERRLGEGSVAMMSQGTSGDLQWRDYGAAAPSTGVEEYAAGLAAVAEGIRSRISHRGDAKLGAAATRLELGRRVPDAGRLAWAREALRDLADGANPRNLREVYAREALMLDAEPRRELTLQALRVGDLGIAAFPNEVYGLTGLKIKARAPFPLTMNIELANGAEGYIPPPEQHALGGYTTWPARTAGLEAGAEPRIAETLLGLLEKTAGEARRGDAARETAHARAARALGPAGRWGLDDLDSRDGGLASDEVAARGSGADREARARLEGGYALHLPGPDGEGLVPAGHGDGTRSLALTANRAVHLAGGRLTLDSPAAAGSKDWTIAFWFRNDLPLDARGTTARLVGRGDGEIWGLGGTSGDAGPGVLFLRTGDKVAAKGRTTIARRTWTHLTIVREGNRARAHLDGRPEPEIEVAIEDSENGAGVSWWLGGGGEGWESESLEGRLDEVAVYARALTPSEIAGLRASAGALRVSPEEPRFPREGEAPGR